MAAALTLLLIGCLLQDALCGQFEVNVPQTIQVLKGSCVTIPCSFNVKDNQKKYLDDTCKALWKEKPHRTGTTVFDSRNPQQSKIKGQLIGDLKKKDCTTILNDMQPKNSKNYYFRLECNRVKFILPKHTNISVTDRPPRPTLTPPTLKVKEGTSVSLTCSAPAPCLSLPPNLTWSPGLGEGQETLQEKQDKTKGKISVLNFTASQLHHGQEISCTAVYRKQDGSTESPVNTSLTADITYSPKETTLSVSPSGPVKEDTNVTLTCRANANPAVKNFTWYRADGEQETLMGTGRVLNIKASRETGPFFCRAANELGTGQSNAIQIEVYYAPQILPSSKCTKAANQVNCSCESTGNPPPAFQWSLDGLAVNRSEEFTISYEHRNGTSVSLTTMSQAQWKDPFSVLCHSSNSLGSASQLFLFYSLPTSAESQEHMTLAVFIAPIVALLVIVCALLVIVCALLCANRAQRTQLNLLKSQGSANTSTVAVSQLETSGEGNEEPNKTHEHIYVNSTELKKPAATQPATFSEPISTNSPSLSQNNTEDASTSSEKKNKESRDVIYTSVTWRSKGKKEGGSSEDTSQSGSSYLEEKRLEGGLDRHFVSNAAEMATLYDEVKPRSMKQDSDCEYAMVNFTD